MLSSDCRESSQQAPQATHAQSSHACTALQIQAFLPWLRSQCCSVKNLPHCHGARLQATPLHASRLSLLIRIHSPILLVLCEFGFTISGIDCMHVAMHEKQATPPDEKANRKNEKLQARNLSERGDFNVRGQEVAGREDQNYTEMCLPALDDSDM